MELGRRVRPSAQNHMGGCDPEPLCVRGS
ncbi:uncharacterized protein G2W53_041174 [Senna tora]|uniref:Uncharacterized protein n=1 Tax=Senna tora TaxID=362788 RepID=A0A834SGZ5_9FABA|nr:uncharacterized protein G2W53_041174 [Senna tora]